MIFFYNLWFHCNIILFFLLGNYLVISMILVTMIPLLWCLRVAGGLPLLGEVVPWPPRVLPLCAQGQPSNTGLWPPWSSCGCEYPGPHDFKTKKKMFKKKINNFFNIFLSKFFSLNFFFRPKIVFRYVPKATHKYRSTTSLE